MTFKPNYVRESISKRKGECKNCSCCEVKLFGKKWNCRHYDKETKKCKVYGTTQMPKICNYYPIDEKDKWNEFKERCGFYWEVM